VHLLAHIKSILLHLCKFKIKQITIEMTTAELFNRIDVRTTTSYGHYKVTIQFRGKQYSCTTTDSMACDRYNDEDAKRGFYTQRDALKSLWRECKRKNNLA
jgi:hypothetical protein